MRIFLIVCSITVIHFGIIAQAPADRWQQRATYDMTIDFDVESHSFQGHQLLTYYNHSPDTLDRVFYHLYYNAFQPGSMMDVRSRTIVDPDPRVGDRISKLKEDEIGYQKINALTMNGVPVDYIVEGTILEVDLPQAIAPGDSAVFHMDFEAQVPLQIRRTGRNSAEGIAYSMSQWYPKMCEYDYQGWHANPYIGREFYGIWGDFKVRIYIDDSYILAGSGIIENDGSGVYGYDDNATPPNNGKRWWSFTAENVHDFMWAADPDYRVISDTTSSGIQVYYVFQPEDRFTQNWETLPQIMDTAFQYIESHYGEYPYPVYSFIQGGDGGMEYPMGTLITGKRSIGSLVGVSVHELMHSWYQMMLGTNEALYPWMDEGFTTFGTGRVMNDLRKRGLIPGKASEKRALANNLRGYINLATSGIEEPLSTHADHFVTNSAYGAGSYTKGAIFLLQLEYILGKEVFDRGLKRYYNTWKFKHPNANDFIRVMEKESNIELDWFKEYFVNTTHVIDYGVKSVDSVDTEKTTVTLEKVGYMPMPLDVTITDTMGNAYVFNIPLRIMRGEKDSEFEDAKEYIVERDWPWTHPTYELNLPCHPSLIQSIVIDESFRMADIDRSNNIWPPKEE